MKALVSFVVIEISALQYMIDGSMQWGLWAVVAFLMLIVMGRSYLASNNDCD